MKTVITRRVSVLHVDEVREQLTQFYTDFLKDVAAEVVEGTGIVPALVLKGIKNLTPEELVEIGSYGFMEMFLSGKNDENKKSPAVAVIMFVPDKDGVGSSYLMTPDSIFPSDFS